MCVRLCASPGAELAERLQRRGRHIAEGGVVAQEQEGQHLEPAANKSLGNKKKLNRDQILSVFDLTRH